MIHLYVFAAVAALDYAYVRYTYTVMARQALAAGYFAAVFMLMTGVSTIAYTSNPWTLPGAVAGAFAGTAFAVWQRGRREGLGWRGNRLEDASRPSRCSDRRGAWASITDFEAGHEGRAES